MKVVATSDFHGSLPDIPECDLLLIGGDVCPVWNHDRKFQADWLRTTFAFWLREQPAKTIVGVGGNHDFVLQDSKKIGNNLPWTYLQDEEVVVDGIKIWGSPMSPTFFNWAFMRDDRGLGELWETIPEDVDILMIHGPFYGVGDEVNNKWHTDPHVGSQTLRNRLEYGNFPKLKLFVTGHIHESYGTYPFQNFTVANVSHVNESYAPVNPPMVFAL